MIFWVLAALVGGLAGVATPAAWWFLQAADDFFKAKGASPFGAFFLPAAVGATVFLLHALFRGFRSADGFTYLISDLHFQDGKRKIHFSFLYGISALLLLAGKAVLGIEAVCMEILSALGSWLGIYFRLSAQQVRTLVTCGATAALAAALGQPTAAFLFLVELLFGTVSYSVGAFALAAFVASSVAQSLTSPAGFFSGIVGNDGGLAVALWSDAAALTSLGAGVGGLVVIGASSLLAALTIWVHKRTDYELHELLGSQKSEVISPAAFGLRLLLWVGLTGLVLMQFPQIFASNFLGDSLSQGFSSSYIFMALLLRISLSALAYSVIGSMGLILPVLTTGGLLGAALAPLLPLPVNGGALALLAMGGYFSAAFGTPVAASALVFGYASGSMTDSALFLATSVIVNFAAHFLCGKMQVDRLATIGLYRHGIRFRSGMCFNTLSLIQVRDAMVTYATPIPGESSLGEAYKRLMESKFSTLPVLDGAGKLQGVISLSDFYGLEAWRKLGEQSQVHSLIGLEELVRKQRVVLRPDMNLETALQKMGDEEIATVSEADGAYLGLLVKSDLVNLYNKEVVKKAFHHR